MSAVTAWLPVRSADYRPGKPAFFSASSEPFVEDCGLNSLVFWWTSVKPLLMMCLIIYNIIAIVAVMYCLFDVNYFVRVTFTMLWRKIIPRKRKRFSEEVHSYGFCTTNDVDFFMSHMNNARFLRELDFSRLDFLHRTGLYDAIVLRKGSALQGATTARYRKPMPIFSFYQVTTKLVYWDDKAIYLEHKFITVSDKFVRAIIISKLNILGLKISLTDLLKIIDPEIEELEAPEDLKHWLQYIDASSQKLKKLN